MKNKIKSSEEEEQIAVIEYCDIKHIPIVHIANEGKRSRAYGALLKRLGMREGFPDLLLPMACRGYHGFFIEMKYGKNKPTDNQVKWLSTLKAEGYATAVCYSAKEAIKLIDLYLSGRDCNAKNRKN